MDVERTNKTSRGKHRWILVKFQGTYTRNSLNQLISSYTNNKSCKLYDFHQLNKHSFGIIKVQLNQYKDIINEINSYENASTLSSSGKIRLIRQRLEKITTR